MFSQTLTGDLTGEEHGDDLVTDGEVNMPDGVKTQLNE